MLFDEPHTLNLKRPTLSRNSDSNALEQDYASPAVDRDLVCMFQTRGGEVAQDEEGEFFPLDAIVYTTDTDLKIDDLLTVILTGTSDKFRVAGIEPKYDVDGEFMHNQLVLTRETRF